MGAKAVGGLLELEAGRHGRLEDEVRKDCWIYESQIEPEVVTISRRPDAKGKTGKETDKDV